MPRKNKYETNVKPHLDKIREWTASGATVKEIAQALGIAESTLHKYQNEKKELSEALTCGRAQVICDIKAALLKKATGFYYTETRQSIKQEGKASDSDDDITDGKEVTYTEKIKRYCVPSETAAAMLLRNLCEDWRDNDSISVKLKKQEHKLKRQIAEANNILEDDDTEGV